MFTTAASGTPLPFYMPSNPEESLRVPLLHVAYYKMGKGGGKASSGSGGGGGSSSGESGGGDGGYLLGVLLSHMIADFATLAAVIRHLAAAYSGCPPPAPAPLPAEPMLRAVAASVPPLPPGFAPYHYALQPPPAELAVFWAAVMSKPPGIGTVFHVPPERLAQLKARAMEDLRARAHAEASSGGAAAAAAGSGGEESGGGGGGSAPWVSTHDAFIAHVWMTLANLPAWRVQNPNAMTVALDMRGRIAPEQCGCSEEEQGGMYGNCAMTALVPEMDVKEGSGRALGDVALEVRKSFARCVGVVSRVGAFLARGCGCLCECLCWWA